MRTQTLAAVFAHSQLMLKVSSLSRPLNFRKEEDLCLPWDPDPVVGLHLAPFAIVAGTAAAGKEPVVDEVDEVGGW